MPEELTIMYNKVTELYDLGKTLQKKINDIYGVNPWADEAVTYAADVENAVYKLENVLSHIEYSLLHAAEQEKLAKGA